MAHSDSSVIGNHTPIVKQEPVFGMHKEAEPPAIHEAIQPPEITDTIEPPITEYIEEVPQVPTISEDMKQVGVRHPTTSVIIHGKEMKLPMALEEVSKGLKEPASSGKHWLALLIEYILAKLGFKVVDKKGSSTVTPT